MDSNLHVSNPNFTVLIVNRRYANLSYHVGNRNPRCLKMFGSTDEMFKLTLRLLYEFINNAWENTKQGNRKLMISVCEKNNLASWYNGIMVPEWLDHDVCVWGVMGNLTKFTNDVRSVLKVKSHTATCWLSAIDATFALRPDSVNT